jgi:hypothetical protein
MITEFPSIRQNILEEEAEHIHFRMERFADYTIEQIKSKNETEIVRCFNFQESKIDFMTAELINALTVSYCESMLLGKCADQMTQTKNLMPIKLKKIYLDYEKWYEELVEKNRIK